MKLELLMQHDANRLGNVPAYANPSYTLLTLPLVSASVFVRFFKTGCA